MPIQYMYPISDFYNLTSPASPYMSGSYFVRKEDGSVTNLYQSIDEGVSTANDSDYLYGYVTSYNATSGNPYSYTGGTYLGFYFDGLNVTPNDKDGMWLNIRYRYYDYAPELYIINAIVYLENGRSLEIIDQCQLKDMVQLNYVPFNTGNWGDVRINLTSAFSGTYLRDYYANAISGVPIQTRVLLQFGMHLSWPTANGLGFDISAIELVSSGDVYIKSKYNSSTLYTQGPSVSQSGQTLYVHCEPPSNSTTLYTQASDIAQTGVPLFIEGHDTSYSGCDLFIEAGRTNEPTSLFIKGNGGTISGGLGLVEWTVGSSSGYSNNSTTLFIGNRNQFSGGATLFIDGPSSGLYNNGATLFIKRETTPSYKGLNLTLKTIESFTPVYSTYATTLFLDNHGYSSGYAPLYITAPSSGSINNSIGLEIFNNHVYSPVNNNLPLMVFGPQTLNSFTSLALQSVRSIAGENTLFLSANTSGNNTTTLYINSEVGGFPNKSATLFLDAPDSLTNPSSGDMTLYTSGPLSTNDFLLNGSSPLSGVGLFIYGTPHTASTTLFVRNGYYDVDNGSMPLVISNRLDSSGQLGLYTIAGLAQNTTDLVVLNNFDNAASGAMPLSIFSSAHSGRFNTATMYVESNGLGTSVPLYIKTDNSANILNTSTLYTKAGNISTANVPMTLQSVYQSYSGVQLNVIGTGDLVGGSVANGQITLFINRPSDNVGNGIGMMINGPSGVNNYVNLSISGGTLVHNNMTLVMPSSIGLNNNNTSLFTHGF